MCGISGVFRYGPDQRPLDRAEVERAIAHMSSRGPDGEGIWSDDENRVVLGHRRLAIIDLSACGAQPMHDALGRFVITFNGEIYNYKTLRATLVAQGWHFRSETDTEVLLALYATRGAEMVHDLRGMFAFAIYDRTERTLFLARDPFGIKPLYVADNGKEFRFASQVKALLAGSRHNIDTRADPAGLVGFLLWGNVPVPHTLYRGVRSLEPGTRVTVTTGGVSVERYARVRDLLILAQEDPVILAPREAAEAVREALLDSVRHHMIADVPVGIFLSAGLDSTTIAALARELGGEVRSLTLGFDEHLNTKSDEVPLAEAVAHRYGLTHRTHRVTRADFETQVQSIMRRMDQPSIDGINTYLVSRAAAEDGLKVALSGVGGDELFAGYPSFSQVPRIVKAGRFVPFRLQVGSLMSRAMSGLAGRLASGKYAALLEYSDTLGRAYFLRRSVFLPSELAGRLDPSVLYEGLESLNLSERLADSVEGLRSPRLALSSLEAEVYLAGQLLRDTDWASMASSLEVRTPLVDWTLWKTVAPIMAGQVVTKRTMANAARPPLPPSVLRRAKSGFVVPTRKWSRVATPARTQERQLRGLQSWALHVLEDQQQRGPQTPSWPGPASRRSRRIASNERRAGIIRALAPIVKMLTHRPIEVSPKRIAILQLQQLGDSLVFTPVLRALRERFPSARIDVVANAVSSNLLLYSPHASSIEEVGGGGRVKWSWKFVKHLLRIRSRGYDMSISDSTQRSLAHGLISIIIGARHRVGFDEGGRGAMFTHAIPYKGDESVLLENMKIARLLGANSSNVSIECHFDQACAERATPLLAGLGDRIIAVHPGSNWQSKRWFSGHWATLCDGLVREGASIVFIGTNADAGLIESIVGSMSHPALSLAGKTDLPTLAAVLSECALLVSTDSGPRHVAAASMTPTVTLMSAHDEPQRWATNRDNEIILREAPACSPCFQSYCSHQTCMQLIEVARVREACQTALYLETTMTVSQ